MAVRPTTAGEIAEQMQVETEERQHRDQRPSRPAPGRERDDQGEGKAVAEHVVVIGPPQQRPFATARQQFERQSEAVGIRDDAGDSDRGATAPVQRRRFA